MINRLFTTNSGLPLFFTSMAPLLLCRPCLCDLFCCFRAPGRCVSCLLSAIFAFDVQHVSLHLRSLAKITYKSRSPVIRLLVIGSYLNRTRKPVIQWPNDLQFLWLLVISSSNGCRLGCLCVLQPTHKDLARLCGFSVQIAGRYVWCGAFLCSPRLVSVPSSPPPRSPLFRHKLRTDSSAGMKSASFGDQARQLAAWFQDWTHQT